MVDNHKRYTGESGDHCLGPSDTNCPIVVLMFCLFVDFRPEAETGEGGPPKSHRQVQQATQSIHKVASDGVLHLRGERLGRVLEHRESRTSISFEFCNSVHTVQAVQIGIGRAPPGPTAQSGDFPMPAQVPGLLQSKTGCVKLPSSSNRE